VNLYCQYSQTALAVVRLCDDTSVHSFIFVSVSKKNIGTDISCRVRYLAGLFSRVDVSSLKTCVCFECCLYRGPYIVWHSVCQWSLCS